MYQLPTPFSVSVDTGRDVRNVLQRTDRLPAMDQKLDKVLQVSSARSSFTTLEGTYNVQKYIRASEQ